MNKTTNASDNRLIAVKSADRVLDLLELLGQGGLDMSHIQISEALQIPKSSLTQLLRNLVARGYVEVTQNGRGYRLGPTLLSLSEKAGQTRSLPDIALPILKELTHHTGESSALNQLKRNMSEVVVTVLGPARLVTHMRQGDLAPLYATSGGKAMLAHMPEDFQQEYFASVQFEPRTSATIKSVRTLRSQIGSIKENGFAYSLEEWTPGIIGVAVALLLPNGQQIGAVSVAIPAVRYDQRLEKTVLRALRDASEEFQRNLGRPR